MGIKLLGLGVIRVVPKMDQAQMAKVQDSIRGLQRAFRGLDKQGLGNLTAGVSSLVLKFASLAGIIKVVSGAVGTLKTFDQLNASLVTIEGSQAKARQALDMLAQFSKVTPFRMQKVTEAFVQMRARGIDVTADSMRSVGNVAAAFGQDITSFSNAVGQAIAGEAERLKMFGISAKFQGKQVEFTFRNKKTTVARESKAISDYLFNLGKVEFAGGIARQAETIGGKFSTLQDNIELFIYEIGKAGVTKAIQELLGEFIKFFDVNAKGGDDVQSLATTIGQRLGSALRDVTRWVREFRESWRPVLQDVTQLIAKLGGLGKAFQAVTATMAGLAVLKLLLRLGEAFGWVKATVEAMFSLPFFAGGFRVAAIATLKLTAVLLLLAIGLDDIITHFRGGDSLLSRFIVNVQKSAGIFRELWNTGKLVVSIFSELFSDISAGTGVFTLLGFVLKTALMAVIAHVVTVVHGFALMLRQLARVVALVIRQVSRFIGILGKLLSGDLKGAAKLFFEGWKDYLDTFGTMLDDVFQTIGNVADALGGLLGITGKDFMKNWGNDVMVAGGAPKVFGSAAPPPGPQPGVASGGNISTKTTQSVTDNSNTTFNIYGSDPEATAAAVAKKQKASGAKRDMDQFRWGEA